MTVPVDTEKAARSSAGLRSLPAALLSELSHFGELIEYPKNTLVVSEGEPADSLYVIVEGQLKVFASDDDGNEVDLNQLGPGEYFGELLLDNHCRTASVRTLARARLSRISRADFEMTIAARPDLAFHLIRNLIARVGALTESVRSLALMDVYQRVARLLQETAVTMGDQQVAPYMSQQSIAGRVGSSRSMVNRILKDLTEGGYVSVQRDGIVLKRTLPKRW